MAGFTRRFGFFPGTEIITQIEGVVIVDLPPPGAVSGVGVGTTAIVGEFADMGYAVTVDAAAGVTTKSQPVEMFSSQDMLNKTGNFDPTIGDFGESGGNGFVTARNKKFSRLIMVPINLCSAKAVRCYRQLATCTSATDPTPVSPVVQGDVAAAREFRDGVERVNLGTAFSFGGLGAYAQAVDGSVTAGTPAVSQTFTSAGSSFLTAKDNSPVKEGDILVVGVIDGAGALGANAATYRVTADATLDTQLTVEQMDGTSYDWTTGTALPFRVHHATDADTGGQHELADAAGYTLPARPLDATTAAATELDPAVDPPALTATTANPLSGLKMHTDPATGLVYDATVQAPNAVSAAALDALYVAAIDTLLGDGAPQRDVSILLVSRHSTIIRAKQKAHVLEASGLGVGRITCMSPELDEQDVNTIIGDTDPGVGGNRDERVIYNWPGAVTFIPEAVGFILGTADGLTTDEGLLDVHLDSWMGGLLSVLPPERNPGQAAAPVPEALAGILGFQRGAPELGMNEYIQFRQKGIAALRFDRTSGPIFQSGITTSLTSGKKNINRRRMADFLQDSLAQRYQQFTKLPLTDALKDSIVAETDAFLLDLQSPNNPPAQRIVDYLIDDEGGNTPDSEAKGIFVVIVKVRTLATADFIVLQSEVGEAVNITEL